jgi:hypothetical protein
VPDPRQRQQRRWRWPGSTGRDLARPGGRAASQPEHESEHGEARGSTDQIATVPIETALIETALRKSAAIQRLQKRTLPNRTDLITLIATDLIAAG